MTGNSGDLYVFAYGSLMWDPGFRFVERQRGLLRGYNRAFCIYSHHYRGTPQNPGLVLGLDRGGACRGIVYRVAAADDKEVRAYLWEREIGNDGVYVEKHLPVLLDEQAGEAHSVSALTYVADRVHPQYAGRLPDDELVRLIRSGVGVKGSCLDYCANTVKHLEELGFRETVLHKLLDKARAS